MPKSPRIYLNTSLRSRKTNQNNGKIMSLIINNKDNIFIT